MREHFERRLGGVPEGRGVLGQDPEATWDCSHAMVVCHMEVPVGVAYRRKGDAGTNQMMEA